MNNNDTTFNQQIKKKVIVNRGGKSICGSWRAPPQPFYSANNQHCIYLSNEVVKKRGEGEEEEEEEEEEDKIRFPADVIVAT